MRLSRALLGLTILATVSAAAITYGNWGPCSSTCGKGSKSRNIYYAGRKVGVDEAACIVQDCTDDWSSCTDTCGSGGKRTRRSDQLQIACNRNPCTQLKSCGQLDIAMVVDSSNSIGYNNWWIMKQFVIDIVRGLPDVTGFHQAALVTFSTEIRTNFELDTHPNLTAVQDDIWKAAYLGHLDGTTNTAGAIKAAAALFDSSRGDRADANNILIVFTDGKSDNSTTTKQAADAARQSGISIFAVGIGNVDFEELNRIAGDSSRVIKVSSFHDLGTKLDQITTSTCVDDFAYDCCLCGGDPHCRTMDGGWIHFQGACKYTMAKPIGSKPSFKVEIKHERRGGRTDVSYPKYLEVSSRGKTARIDKNKVFTVDGKKQSASNYHDAFSGIRSSVVGKFVQVTLQNGVKVSYDGDWISYVCVPKTKAFQRKMEGICGNYDGSSRNDYVTKDGVTQKPDIDGYNAIGNSWKVSDPDDSTCPDWTKTPNCSRTIELKAPGDDYCGPLRNTSGVFSSCLGRVPYEGYYKSCVDDMCAATSEAEMKAIRCKYAEYLASECKSIKKEISNWANETGCSAGVPEYGVWGTCSATCTGGIQTRSFTCLYPAPETSACQNVITSQDCNQNVPCSIDGGWTPWGPPSQCSVTCGSGTQTLRRTCTNPAPKYGGADCVGKDTMIKSCIGQTGPNCPVDGVWTSWGPPSQCSVTCGSGTQTLRRTCTNPAPKYGGADCIGKDTMIKSCIGQAGPKCPVDGGWTPWGPPNQCSVTCGSGTQTLRRTCTNPAPKHGGADCIGKDTMIKSCIGPAGLNCPVDGGWTTWGNPSQCSVTCGSGTQTLKRTCKNPAPQYGGANCKGNEIMTQTCTGSAGANCPIDGMWTSWGPPSECSVTCGSGTQTLKRTCTNPSPQYGGANCIGSNIRTQACAGSAGKNCAISKSDKCRRCTYNDDNVGYLADDNDQTIYYQCKRDESGYTISDPMKCPTTTLWDQNLWTCVFAKVKSTCSGKVRQKNPDNCAGYIVCVHGKPTYKCCGTGTYWNDAISNCDWNRGQCAKTCTKSSGSWGPWGYWGACSAPCGAGVKYRYRSCSGSGCSGKSSEQTSCNNGPCTDKCTEGSRYRDASNCAAYKLCVHGSLKFRCCPAGTYFNGASCGGSKTDGTCSMSCVKSSGSCAVSQLVRLTCGSVRNMCTTCPVSNTNVTANNGVCNFNPLRKARLQFNCFNNRFNGKNVVNFAVMTWFKSTGSTRQSILHNGDCQESPSFEIYLDPRKVGQKVVWYVVATLNGKQVGSIEVTHNTWNHVSLVVSGGTARLSVRTRSSTNQISTVTGSPQSVQMRDPVGSTKCPLTVGQSGGTNQFSGQMDELRVYETGFSDDQVADMCKNI